MDAEALQKTTDSNFTALRISHYSSEGWDQGGACSTSPTIVGYTTAGKIGRKKYMIAMDLRALA